MTEKKKELKDFAELITMLTEEQKNKSYYVMFGMVLDNENSRKAICEPEKQGA